MLKLGYLIVLILGVALVENAAAAKGPRGADNPHIRRYLAKSGKKLRHHQTNECAGSGTALWDCSDSSHVYTFNFDREQLKIVNGQGSDDGKCVGLGGNYQNCHNGASQKWKKHGVPGEPGYYRYQNKADTNMYLDDYQDSWLDTEDDNPTCPCQWWKLE